MSRCQFLSTLAVASVLAGQLGCTQEIRDTRAADEQLIRTAEIEAVNAFNAGDIEGYMVVYAEDSLWLPPNAPTVHGAVSIRALAAQLAADPEFDFSVQLTTVEVSRAGDQAYLVGSYQMTLSDADGNPATDIGKFAEVWKKHADNTWKHGLAIWNSDGPSQ